MKTTDAVKILRARYGRYVMKHSEFEQYLNYLIDTHIKGKICSKSKEYVRGDDKLYNFKRAAQEDNITPIEALRGMDLKHRVSIKDMLDDLLKGVTHPQEMWEEKITDHINYMFLTLAVLAEWDQWDYIKPADWGNTNEE